MKPLFNIDNIEKFLGNEKLPFECEECGSEFFALAKYIRSHIKLKKNPCSYCCAECRYKAGLKGEVTPCNQCGKQKYISKAEKNKSKSGRFFCSKNCAAVYNNCHKTTGCTRSKLEIWLESKISNEFPKLKALYNNKETINSELDIYFPTLKLAIELNGIFHYEPIHGIGKLTSTQNNDHRKFQACLEHNIELVIIDVSTLVYFKPEKAVKYFDIIKNILTNKLHLLNQTLGAWPTAISL